MLKREQYIKLLQDKPWSKLKEIIHSAPRPNKIEKPFHLDIDLDKVIQYTVDNIKDAQEITMLSRPVWNNTENDTEDLNMMCGRREYNMDSLNWGLHGDSDANGKKLIGEDNIKMLNLNPDYVLARWKVKTAGQGTSWHQDFMNTYQRKFPDLKIDFATQSCQYGKLIRYFVPLNPWEDGHAIQIGNEVITKWTPGDVYIIPWGVFHCAYNMGYVPNYTLNITGVLNG